MNQEHITAPVAPAPPGRREHGGESIVDLIRHLGTDLSTLLDKEVELAKSEVRESVSEVQVAVGAVAMGTAIAMAGLVVLFMSAVYGLSNVVDPWFAALIVGAAGLLVGYLIVRSAKGKMRASNLVPERMVESARKLKETLKETTR